MNILFFHGLDSSAETNKFEVIKKSNKFAVTVDYRKLSYHEVGLLYNKLIQKYQPDILVGHSLGGYWALSKSREFEIPCLAINPTLYPDQHFDDYVDLKTLDFNDDVKRSFHLEMNDEVIDLSEVFHWAEDKTNRTNIHEFLSDEGHHRVHFLDEINKELDDLIDFIELY